MKVHYDALAIWLLLATDFLQAGPPFVTDDPEPPPAGGWEINVPFILERTPGKTEMDAPLFDLNYGLPDIQLKLEFPIAIVNEDNNGTQAGAGDSLIGVKWRFFNNERSQFQLGTYPQVLAPTGNHSSRARRRPCRICAAVSRAEKLGEVDALRQHRLLVARRARNAQLLLRRCGART